MIPKLFLNTQMIWVIFIEIMKNPNNKRKINVFDDMIGNMLINKKYNPIVTQLVIRGRKLNNLILLCQKILD